jgi:hypothetical protein
MMKKLVLSCFVILALLSCEKTINIKTDATSPKLVVDAEIENDLPPTVILSTSIGYYATIDSTILTNSFVHNAFITISDGTKTHQLKEYKVPASNGFIYYYSSDPSKPTTYMKGILGKTYQLKITYHNQLYSGSTTIPALTKKMDSIWWKPLSNYPDSPQVVIMTRVTDPPGLGNYIRYFTKQNSAPFLPGYNSVFDDQIVDGKTYSIQIDRGVDRNQKIDRANYGYFLKGDTATIKLCNIDRYSYDFWRTWEYAFQSIGNPFSAPGKVIGNINNGALGSFCGYAAQYKTLIIPK